MSDDTQMAALRAELARQDEEAALRHELLVAELERQRLGEGQPEAKPLTAEEARETLRRGYAAGGGDQ